MGAQSAVVAATLALTPKDYADDFTPTRNNDFIDVCQPQKAADCDVTSLDGKHSGLRRHLNVGLGCDCCHDSDGRPLVRQA